MSFTELDIFNMALAEVKSATVSAISEKSDISGQQLSDLARDKTLGMYDWKFARKRKRITASGILDASTRTIAFVDSDPDTITDSGSGFLTARALDGDVVTTSGSGSNNTSYVINTAAAGTLTLESYEEVTAESLVNDTDLKLFFSPASRWGLKFPRPSDAVRILGIGEYQYHNFGVNNSGLSYYGLQDRYNMWDIEGNFIVTNIIDDNDQLPVKYTQRVTDVSLFTDLFVNVNMFQLASLLAIPLANDNELRIALEVKSNKVLLDSLASMAGEGPYLEERPETSWQRSGRRGSRSGYNGNCGGDRW